MVVPGAVFRFGGETRRGVSWCHRVPYDASAAVTDLGENYVQIRMDTQKKKDKKRFSPQSRGVFGRVMVSHHKIVSPQNGDTQAPPPPPPPPATPLIRM